MKNRRNDLGVFKKGKVFLNDPSQLKNWSVRNRDLNVKTQRMSPNPEREKT